MLAAPKDNLFIVGDDDQSIYRFRGAKPEIMLGFEKEYPAAKKVCLDINYRSAGRITEAAAKLIRHNKNRFSKDIRAFRGEGVPVSAVLFPNLPQENDRIAEEILACHRRGMPFSEIAVLFRTNTQPRALLEKLMEYNIPFRIREGIPNLYDHWIAGDIKAYIKMAMGGRSRAEFLKIMNRPKRYINREYIDGPFVDFERLKCFYKEKPRMEERISRLVYDLGVIQKMCPFAAMNYIRKGVGYEDYLKEYAEQRKIRPEELFDILEELQELSRDYAGFEEWFEHVERYGRELERQREDKERAAGDRVAMNTMHGAKGLEYRAVFIIDANEGIAPYKKAVLEEELEEERRMFYVALTRAKERLYVYAVKERYNRELAPSRFIKEMGLEERLQEASPMLS